MRMVEMNEITRFHEGDYPLIRIRALQTVFSLRTGDVYAVNGLDFDLRKGERLALLGESGCGKSVLAQTIFRLLPENARVSGEVTFRGKDLLTLDSREMEEIRGREIGLIPQHLSALDPLMRIDGQVWEACSPRTRYYVRDMALQKVSELLRAVNLNAGVGRKYPHELSGGMNRRSLISMGIAQNPPVLIADEPTTGLDTIIRRKVISLIDKMTCDQTLLLITHDVNTARICEHLAVMYAGEIIEKGRMDEILNEPAHPYTRGLIASMPAKGMNQIPGQSPSLVRIPTGCRFHPRCSKARDICSSQHPDLTGDGRKVRCHFALC